MENPISLSLGVEFPFFISQMEQVFPLQKKASILLDAVVQQFSCVVLSVSPVMSDNQEVLGS